MGAAQPVLPGHKPGILPSHTKQGSQLRQHYPIRASVEVEAQHQLWSKLGTGLHTLQPDRISLDPTVDSIIESTGGSGRDPYTVCSSSCICITRFLSQRATLLNSQLASASALNRLMICWLLRPTASTIPLPLLKEAYIYLSQNSVLGSLRDV